MKLAQSWKIFNSFGFGPYWVMVWWSPVLAISIDSYQKSLGMVPKSVSLIVNKRRPVRILIKFRLKFLTKVFEKFIIDLWSPNSFSPLLVRSLFWTCPAVRRVLWNQLRRCVCLSVHPSVRPSVCLSVCQWQKFSYFLPLDFSDFLHHVSPW